MGIVADGPFCKFGEWYFNIIDLFHAFAHYCLSSNGVIVSIVVILLCLGACCFVLFKMAYTFLAPGVYTGVLCTEFFAMESFTMLQMKSVYT